MYNVYTRTVIRLFLHRLRVGRWQGAATLKAHHVKLQEGTGMRQSSELPSPLLSLSMTSTTTTTTTVLSPPTTCCNAASVEHALASSHEGVHTSQDGLLLIKPALPQEHVFYRALLPTTTFDGLRPYIPKFYGSLNNNTLDPATSSRSCTQAGRARALNPKRKDEYTTV